MPNWKTPSGAILWVVGVICTAVILRIGWELGGKVWGLL